MTPKALAAAVFAVLAVAACGTGTRSSTSGAAEDARALAWAECLRAHGIPNFPDPLSGHEAQFPDSAGPIFNSHSPAVLTAEQACKGLHAALVGANPGPSPNQNAAFLTFSRCMRAHGVPNYPDPTSGKNGRPIGPDLSSVGIDTQSPAFVSAAKACNGHGIPLGSGLAER